MTRKTTVCLCLSLGLVLFAAGLILIFCAAPLGIDAAGSALRANGGTMDSGRYQFILESRTVSCQLGGVVCALTGGASALLAAFLQGAAPRTDSNCKVDIPSS